LNPNTEADNQRTNDELPLLIKETIQSILDGYSHLGRQLLSQPYLPT
jgi:hypothetical protein